MSRITDIDLNLLTAFDLLMVHNSVSVAARKLGITQSAMSHILNRLRKQFGDALFVKSANGMLPTQRAKDLHTSFAYPLKSLQLALDTQKSFAPATAKKNV